MRRDLRSRARQGLTAFDSPTIARECDTRDKARRMTRLHRLGEPKVGSDSYNGWTNHETWCANIWLTNDEYTDRESRRIAHGAIDVRAAADALEAYAEDMLPDLGATFAADLLQSAFGEIDWDELAESFREDMAVECAYCGRDVPGTGEEPTPAVDDDDAWIALAHHHADDCEWIATRAHRINV